MSEKTIKIRGLVLGDNIPKICVPVTAKNETEMSEQLKKIAQTPCDMVEWRADFYEELENEQWVENALAYLRKSLGEKPLLFTFRTKEEGGERSISLEEYEALAVRAAQSVNADAVDIEINRGEELLKRTVERVHREQKVVIGSYHNFSKTPSTEEIIQILCKIQTCGADVSKAALMPCTERDVLTVLDATLQMKETYADRPFITMSMSRLGVLSRLAGQWNGSALTFGTAGKASAPGQMEAVLLKEILKAL